VIVARLTVSRAKELNSIVATTAPLQQRLAEDSPSRRSDVSITSEPVFIVGMNGSGTTMLLDCLNNHPAFYGFPIETKILPVYLERRADYGNLAIDANFRRLWDDLRNIVYFRIVNGRETPPLPEDWIDRERTFGAALDGVFRYFAEREGKQRWCEKSPMYALYIDVFAEIFPNAKFIHVIRDGRDCAASFHRRWAFNPERTIYRWKAVVTRGRELGRPLGERYMELRYEDLTSDPERHMRRVCAFLGEPFHEATLVVERPTRNVRKALSDAIIPNAGKWRTYFSSSEIERLELVGGRLLHELGYETNRPEGDENPGWARLWYWRCRDNARRTADGLGLLLTIKDPKRRRLVIDKLVTNARHKMRVGVQ
jgi:hypothetical protein